MEREETDNELLFAPRTVAEGERALGRYRLLHELGSGGMAKLFLAIDPTGCLVAVKRLHAHLAAERRFLEMFHDEATIAARISHPHVCKVHGLEQVSGQIFIVMEYIHGESLAALLKQLATAGRELPVEAALHLVGQACLGLHAAHEQRGDDGRPLRVVHRDISPHNLLVSYEGELKIVDFGIASAVARLHHTETGTIKGKFGYMSPEQTSGDAVDRRADIFCLGVVLYEAACGARCFAGSTMAEIVRRVQAAEYRPPRALRPDLPPAAETIIVRALAREPRDRYQSADEMYRDVYAHLAASPLRVSTGAIGELMRRAFARRYALREELRSLAFAAPEVLEEEQITVVEPARSAPALRCEYCGAEPGDKTALAAHLAGCAQRAWWEHNFGGSRALEGAGDAQFLRQRSTRQVATAEERTSLWQRVRRSLMPDKRKKDPLVVRLESIGTRLAAVRDPRGEQLSGRAMTALWGMVAEITDKAQSTSGHLLARIKPRVLACAEVILGVTLEIETNAAFLASTQDRDLEQQIESLERRAQLPGAEAVAREIERTIRHKRALLAERATLAQRNELLALRLESMVDAVELTLGKILQITGTPDLMRELEATTQIGVFLDSMLVEVQELGQSLREAQGTLR